MKTAIRWQWVVVMALAICATAFAEGRTGKDPLSAGEGLLGIGAGVGVGFLVFGAGFGISRIASAACESIARQPEAAEQGVDRCVQGNEGLLDQRRYPLLERPLQAHETAGEPNRDRGVGREISGERVDQ